MKKYSQGGIYTAEMGKPPQDIDGASAAPMPKRPPMKRPPMKKPAPKGSGIFREGMPVPQDIDGGSVKPYKNGGSVSTRADGIAKRGRTNCKTY